MIENDGQTARAPKVTHLSRKIALLSSLIFIHNDTMGESSPSL